MAKRNKIEAKKFLPDKNSPATDTSTKSIAILKLAIFILLLPIAVASSLGFLNSFSVLDKVWVNSFWAGVFVFFLIDLVVYRLDPIYKKGQKLIEVIFHFFSPLVKFAPYVLPVYSLLILIFSIAIGFFGVISSHQRILLFLLGFSITLHLVYTADALRAKQTDFLRGSHLFTIIIIYLFNMLILSFTIDRILPDSAFFVDFFHSSYVKTGDIYQIIFAQFFLY